MTLFTNRFSHHPERYIEIVGVLRKYELHHLIAKFLLSHRHEEEVDDTLLLPAHQEVWQRRLRNWDPVLSN